jgi:hypothetical protein
MKKLLFSLFVKFFKKELSLIQEPIKEEKTKQEKVLEEKRKLKINYPIGTKIIAQSNEPEDLLVASVCDYQEFHHGTFLVVQKDNGTQAVLLDQNPMLYCKEREDALKTLPWFQRYNVMTRNSYYVDYQTAQGKENSKKP